MIQEKEFIGYSLTTIFFLGGLWAQAVISVGANFENLYYLNLLGFASALIIFLALCIMGDKE